MARQDRGREDNADNLKLILGLKIRQLRLAKNLALKDLSSGAALSISYLSEIEKGKKYPTPDKILKISKALDVSFDDLVSLNVSAALDPLTDLLDSPFLREFPFELFGIAPSELMKLVTDSPKEAGAFVRTLLEISQTYDMSVEQFFFAALRSYQKLHSNYFEDLETIAEQFLRDHKWKIDSPKTPEQLGKILTTEYGYRIEETSFQESPELRRFRSICTPDKPKTLYLNERLLPSQKAFLLAREIGFCTMGLKEHPLTSTWLTVTSFAEVLNNFKASYFAGALLLNQELLVKDFETFFKNDKWEKKAFLAIMNHYDATPEMFFYRLSEIIPRHFGLKEMFYLRFSNMAGSKEFRLTKELNLSRVVVPRGIGINEHYCRRWLSIRLLEQIATKQGGKKSAIPLIDTQRSRFIESGAEFFVITVARPLALVEGINSSISLGFLLNETFKETVRFWNDDSLKSTDVNETCERCSLTTKECHERAVPPAIHRKLMERKSREEALSRFLEQRGKQP